MEQVSDVVTTSCDVCFVAKYDLFMVKVWFVVTSGLSDVSFIVTNDLLYILTSDFSRRLFCHDVYVFLGMTFIFETSCNMPRIHSQ